MEKMFLKRNNGLSGGGMSQAGTILDSAGVGDQISSNQMTGGTPSQAFRNTMTDFNRTQTESTGYNQGANSSSLEGSPGSPMKYSNGMMMPYDSNLESIMLEHHSISHGGGGSGFNLPTNISLQNTPQPKRSINNSN